MTESNKISYWATTATLQGPPYLVPSIYFLHCQTRLHSFLAAQPQLLWHFDTTMYYGQLMLCQMSATLSATSYGQGAWHMRMHEDICVLQHTLRQMSAPCPRPNTGRWHASRRWWITRTQNTRPSKVSIVIFCHLFSHGTKRHNLTFYEEFATNCVKRT